MLFRMRIPFLPGLLAGMLLTAWAAGMVSRSAFAGEIEILRVPGGGLQPQVATGADGTVHLVYLGGDPAHADVWYCRRAPGDRAFGEPVRVNRAAGAAMAIGTVRGAQLALGAEGTVWVVWNGSDQRREPPVGARLWLAVSRREGGFRAEQELNASTEHLDGGASVAAGASGESWVVWHSSFPGRAGETNRAVFARHTVDGGQQFSADQRLDSAAEGACGCCGLKAAGRSDGRWAVLYRTASEGGVFRDMTLLLGGAGAGAEVLRVPLDRWSANVCPMSTAALVWAGESVVAAWETRGQVHLARVHGRLGVVERIEVPRGGNGRKHPSVAVDATGGMLLAWVEGTGWARGGDVAWQRFDAGGKPLGASGRRTGVPVWGSVGAFSVGETVGLLY